MITFLSQRPQIGIFYHFGEVIKDGAFSGKKYTAVCKRMVKRESWQGASGLNYEDEFWEFVRTDTGESFVTAVETSN